MAATDTDKSNTDSGTRRTVRTRQSHSAGATTDPEFAHLSDDRLAQELEESKPFLEYMGSTSLQCPAGYDDNCRYNRLMRLKDELNQRIMTKKLQIADQMGEILRKSRKPVQKRKIKSDFQLQQEYDAAYESGDQEALARATRAINRRKAAKPRTQRRKPKPGPKIDPNCYAIRNLNTGRLLVIYSNINDLCYDSCCTCHECGSPDIQPECIVMDPGSFHSYKRLGIHVSDKPIYLARFQTDAAQLIATGSHNYMKLDPYLDRTKLEVVQAAIPFSTNPEDYR